MEKRETVVIEVDENFAFMTDPNEGDPWYNHGKYQHCDGPIPEDAFKDPIWSDFKYVIFKYVGK